MARFEEVQVVISGRNIDRSSFVRVEATPSRHVGEEEIGRLASDVVAQFLSAAKADDWRQSDE